MFQTIPTLYKQWSVTLDIMPTGIVSGWSNILRVGLGGDMDRYGDRTPGIWFVGKTTQLHIPSAIDGNKDFYTYGFTEPLPMNTWTRVVVTQLRQSDGSYQFMIKVGNSIFAKLTNNKPTLFHDVKVYTSDNYFTAAKANITKPIIWTKKDELPPLIPGGN